MASLLSPGVLTREIDLTTIVPAGASTEGGISIHTHWGPSNKLVLLSSEKDLVDTFGKPSDENAAAWFTAKNFLSYANALYVSRALDLTPNTGAMNSSILGSDLLDSGISAPVRNLDDVERYSDTTETVIARYPGVAGNSLKFWLVDYSSFTGSTYESEFTSGPPDLDEIHVLVIDEGGYFSGIKGTILEKYEFLSKCSDGKYRDGSSSYYKQVLNNSSSYIAVVNDLRVAGQAIQAIGKKFDEVLEVVNPATGALGFTAASGVATTDWDLSEINTVLSGGRDGDMSPSSATHDANILTGLELFKDDELVDISFLLGADGQTVIANELLNIASSRKDCLACISPRQTDVVNQSSPYLSVKSYRDGLNIGGLKDLKSSYMVMDDNWKYQFDKYNNVNRWVPCNGDTAGLMAETDLEKALWFSPGGRSLKNVIKLAWKSKRVERDVLYPLGVNSITTFPGEGALLFGDRTMLRRPSAFDRINVRRLFIYLRKVIARASRSLLFEQNTEFTRNRFISIVEPTLREIQARQGITDFKVVCDESNNTGNVIDSNRFIGDIYIKPARSINFIELNFVAVRTDVEFTEVVGSF